MLKSAQALMMEYLDIHNQRRKVLLSFAIIALVVAITVVSLTIFPAITMQGDDNTICGLKEHTHSEECYTRKLICELPEVEEHHHGEGCYESQLVCENVDEDHIHTEECYENVLICTAEETDGHTHTDECYEEELACELPEHTHTDSCYPEDKPVKMNELVLDGTHYVLVNSIKDFSNSNSSYLIVSPDSYGAITLSEDNKTELTQLAISPIEGNKGAYSIKSLSDNDVSSEKFSSSIKWSIVVGENTATIRNAYDGRYYVNLSTAFALGRESDVVGLEFNEIEGTWKISKKIDGVVHYLSNKNNNVVNAKNISEGNNKWLIYKISSDKLADAKINSSLSSDKKTPNIDASSLVKKKAAASKAKSAKSKSNSALSTFSLSSPTMLADLEYDNNGYVSESNAVSGTTIYKKNIWEYDSDPATSQIEKWFNGVKSDDGKVVVDKSVIYGADDYDAFDEYGFGTFGVELSALAQQYNVTRNQIIDIPVDVVFIIDTSGSMLDAGYTGTVKAQTTVEAMNPAIDAILKANPENRIGIVRFSNTSTDMLELDYYNTRADGNYMTFANEQMSISIPKRSGGTATGSTSGQKSTWTNPDWGGTYTQHGIARANAMFQRNNITTYIDQEGNEVQRKPIIILLSDGEPTYCTSNYANVFNGPHYGDGTSSQVNTQGVNGYYTILSAVHYKQQIANHYNNPNTEFYTIGIGISSTGTDFLSESIAPSNYVRCVLNPTDKNVDEANNSSIANNATMGGELQQLLRNTYTGSSVTIDNVDSSAVGATNTVVPVISNPYITSGYSYADGAYFGQMSPAELTEVFQTIIQSSLEKVEYGFNLREATTATITDPIGIGMEVKGDPVLRYNGENYVCTSKETTQQGLLTITEYVYDYVATDPNIIDVNDNIRSVELSTITVQVITMGDGTQVVQMQVPEGSMPVYAPDFDSDTYHEELPVRLIYQVGLTDEALANAQEGDVFYTNRWQDGYTANTGMYPAPENPYYENGVGPYQNSHLTKTSNPTGTNNNANSYISSSNQTRIDVALGNNGKLTLGAHKEFVSITAQKEWQDENGVRITNTADLPDVTVKLYRKLDKNNAEEELVETIKLGNSNNWQKQWTELPYCDDNDVLYTYYIKEIVPDGYVPSMSAPLTGQDGTLKVTNKKIPDNGAVAVKKVWRNYFGDIVENTKLMPEVDVELWRHVQIQEPQGVTVIIKGDNTVLATLTVEKGSNVTYAIRANYNPSAYAYWATISRDGAAVTSSRGGSGGNSYRYTGTQTITANSDITVTYTSSYAVASWGFQTQPSYRPAVAGSGELMDGPDEKIDETTLNDSGGWQYYWDDLPVSEVKSDGNTYFYKYFVKEINEIPGYTTSYSDGNEQGVQGGELIITNKADNAMGPLPETGSIGTGCYIMGGIAVVLCSSAMLCWRVYIIRRKRIMGITPSTKAPNNK